MNVFTAILLGLIQGLAEFLPVSSSGHLLLAERIVGITDASIGHFFIVLLHLGTLAAVLFVYRKRIIEMILHPVKQWQYWIYMIAATLVTVVMALALRDVFNRAESGSILGPCFLVTAALLAVTDLLRKKAECRVTVPTMKWYHALFIGFLQGIAPLPGVSRSGATITGATLCRMKREDAAEFSFLLSIPAILGGAVLEIPAALKEGVGDISVLCCIVGVLVAAVSGYFAVKFMIRLITKRSFKGFVIYTALLGVFVILDQLVFHLIDWGF